MATEPRNVSHMDERIDAHALDGFEQSSFSHDGATRTLYSIGTGPAVIVVHEIPGITPLVAGFGRKIADRGMTAVLPDLFGTPGRHASVPYAMNSLAKACVSREFSALATNKTSPITQWLRALALDVHGRHGGPGIGVVGMCLTGGIALGMMVDPVVVAPVLSQPSLPFGLTRSRRQSVGVSDEDLSVVKERVADGVCVMGLRFTGDPAVPAARFQSLRQHLGDGFIGVEIDSSKGNPWGYSKAAHSVLTEHYKDDDGSPTRLALEGVLDFFAERLGIV